MSSLRACCATLQDQFIWRRQETTTTTTPIQNYSYYNIHTLHTKVCKMGVSPVLLPLRQSVESMSQEPVAGFHELVADFTGMGCRLCPARKPLRSGGSRLGKTTLGQSMALLYKRPVDIYRVTGIFLLLGIMAPGKEVNCIRNKVFLTANIYLRKRTCRGI